MALISRDDILLFEYEAFKGQHGRRPSGSEVFDTGIHLKPLKERHETWFDFIASQGDATSEEKRVLSRHREWFSDLLRTDMSKSYKMIALQALIDADQLPGQMSVEENARRARQVMAKNILFYRELTEDEGRRNLDAQFVGKWREMPLAIWAKGKGTKRKWFTLEGSTFGSQIDVAEGDIETFVSMTEEMVKLRLREHVDRLRNRLPIHDAAAPIQLKVSHASRRPILRFDRERRPDVPEGDTPVIVDETPYTFHFRKIAVNEAVEEYGGPNVLPALIRGWYGMNAGHPGTRQYVYLDQTDAGWRLSPDSKSESTAGAEVTPLPRLPFFAELEVACGAFSEPDRMSETKEWLAVRSQREADPKRHFLVRASGDSMDGGLHPIPDGALVLCEWWQGGAANQIVGHPFLLVGHPDAEASFATMKVPKKRKGRWVLEGYNPNFEPMELQPGVRLEPVARVLEVVEEAEGLSLWSTYNRDGIAGAFGYQNNRSWEVGHRDVSLGESEHTVLMVKLKKGADVKPEHRYADRFLSRTEFQWESQRSTKETWAKARRIINHQSEGRQIHLFVRYHGKQDFTYCGTVRYQRHEGSEPVRVWFELDHALPAKLWKLWEA